jgi:hypothetical protein
MKQYKLLKDLPGLKKGTILSEGKSLFGARTLITKNDVGPIFISNDLTEDLFEEIKEPTDSIHWEPKNGDEYFYISDYGDIYSDNWCGKPIDYERLALGFIYSTEKECKKAKERRLAKARLRLTSTFKPDPKKGRDGYIVVYDQMLCVLDSISCSYKYGQVVHYETKEDAQKSIKENREDWLIYFGIEEGNQCQ